MLNTVQMAICVFFMAALAIAIVCMSIYCVLSAIEVAKDLKSKPLEIPAFMNKGGK